MQREPEVAERLFKLNDDAQVVKIAYEGVCDGGTSLSMAMELVTSLSVMQTQTQSQSFSHIQPSAMSQNNPSTNSARVSEPSLIDHLGVDNDPFDLNPMQSSSSSSSSVSQPVNRYVIQYIYPCSA